MYNKGFPFIIYKRYASYKISTTFRKRKYMIFKNIISNKNQLYLFFEKFGVSEGKNLIKPKKEKSPSKNSS